jgi:hypothetical protein
MTYSDSLRINEIVIFVHFQRYISLTLTMECKQTRLRNETFHFRAMCVTGLSSSDWTEQSVIDFYFKAKLRTSE